MDTAVASSLGIHKSVVILETPFCVSDTDCLTGADWGVGGGVGSVERMASHTHSLPFCGLCSKENYIIMSSYILRGVHIGP